MCAIVLALLLLLSSLFYGHWVGRGEKTGKNKSDWMWQCAWWCARAAYWAARANEAENISIENWCLPHTTYKCSSQSNWYFIALHFRFVMHRTVYKLWVSEWMSIEYVPRDINSPFMLCVINKSEIYIDRPMELTTTIQIVCCVLRLLLLLLWITFCESFRKSQQHQKIYSISKRRCEKTKVSVDMYTNWIAQACMALYRILSISSWEDKKEIHWCVRTRKNKKKQKIKSVWECAIYRTNCSKMSLCDYELCKWAQSSISIGLLRYAQNRSVLLLFAYRY